MAEFGTDIDSSFDLDLRTGRFKKVSGLNNLKQRIYKRLMTRMNELIEFGYYRYGNSSYLVIGHTDINVAALRVEVYTTECLKYEPDIKEVIGVRATAIKGQDIEVYISVLPLGEYDNPIELNLNWNVFSGEITI